MVWLNLTDMLLQYYDTVGRDQDPGDRAYHATVGRIVETMAYVRAQADLPCPEIELRCRRAKVRNTNAPCLCL